jgi:hypothetical protein
MQPGFFEEVQRVVNSGKFPFRSPGEFHRFATVHTLGYLNGLQEVPKSVMRQAQIMAETCRQFALETEYAEVFTTLRRTVEQLLRAAEDETTRDLLGEQSKLVELMPDGYWKNRYRRRLLELEMYAYSVMNGDIDLPSEVSKVVKISDSNRPKTKASGED